MLNIRATDLPSFAANYITLSAFSPSQGMVDEMYGIVLSVIISLITKIAGEYMLRQYAKRKIRRSYKATKPNSITQKKSEDEKKTSQ